MILLRKPTIQDVYKSVLLLSDNKKEQANLLHAWLLQLKNNNTFYSLVAVKKKKVLALLTSTITVDTKENITVYVGELSGPIFLKKKLIEKVKKEFDPQIINITVQEKEANEYIKDFKMVVLSINLCYNIENMEDELILEESVTENSVSNE